MPYINVKTSCSISDEKEVSVKTRLGEAISLLPGKSESWLMVSIDDNCRMWFKGQNDEACAFTEVKSFGSINKAASEKLTAAICNILNEELSISTDRIYVRYEETELWGWNKRNF